MDLFMREYRQPLSELRTWTFGQALLFLRRIEERYNQQTKKQQDKREIGEGDLERLGLMAG